MEYLIGLVLALALVGFATFVGFAHDRAFAPTVLIVVASYYVLFAVMGGSGRTLLIEIAIASGFLALAVVGFKTNLWLIAAAVVAHGVLDYIHPSLVRIVECRVGGRASVWRLMCSSADGWPCYYSDARMLRSLQPRNRHARS